MMALETRAVKVDWGMTVLTSTDLGEIMYS